MSEMPPDEYPIARVLPAPSFDEDEPTLETPTVELPEIGATTTIETGPIATDESSVAILGLKRFYAAFRLGIAEHKAQKLKNGLEVSAHSAEFSLQEKPVMNEDTGHPESIFVTFRPASEGALPAFTKVERDRTHRPVTWAERRGSLFRARQNRKMHNLNTSQAALERNYGKERKVEDVKLGSVKPLKLFKAERKQHGRDIRSLSEKLNYIKAYKQRNRAKYGGFIKRHLHLPVGSDRILETTQNTIQGKSPIQRINTLRLNRANKQVSELKNSVKDLRARHIGAQDLTQQRKDHMKDVRRSNKYYTSRPVTINRVEADLVTASPFVTAAHETRANAKNRQATRANNRVVDLERRAAEATDEDKKKKLVLRATAQRRKSTRLTREASGLRTEVKRRRAEKKPVDVTGWM